MNLWVWFIWWQKCANRRKISLIRKHLTFDAAQLLDQALVTSKLGCCNFLLYGLPKVVIKHLQRVQNSAAGVTLSPKFVILHLFLQIFPGSRLIFGLTLKYLSLPTILSMDLLLLIFKIFFKVISRHGILGLQRKIYFPRLHLTWTVIAVVFLLLLRLDLWNSLPHHIRECWMTLDPWIVENCSF